MATVEIGLVSIVKVLMLVPTKQSQEHGVWDVYPFKEEGYAVDDTDDIVQMLQDLVAVQAAFDDQITIVRI